MKKLSITLLILLLSVPAFSQFLRFGVKAGVESSIAPEYKLKSSGMNPAQSLITNAQNSSWGFHGGVFMRIKFWGLYAQPEIVFTSNSFDYEVGSGHNYKSTFPIYTEPQIISQRFNRLSVPLLIGTKLGPLRINAGPAASIQIGSPKDLINDPKFGDMYKRALWGFQAGVGVDIFKNITFDVRYAGSLGEKYGGTYTIGNQSYKLDHGQNSFLVSLGFMF
jgi:hypothetical protein